MEKTKVYVAARYEDRDDALDLKSILEIMNFVVTSRWLLPDDADNGMEKIKRDEAFCERLSVVAEEDIAVSDVVVVLSPLKAHRSGTGGRHVEVGIAIGTKKPVVLYGEPENVFHFRKRIRKVAWDDLCGLRTAIQESFLVYQAMREA